VDKGGAGLTRQQIRDRLDALRAQLKALFDGCRDAASGELKMTGEQIAEANRRNEELSQKGLAFDSEYQLYAMDVKNREALERAAAADRRVPLPGAGPADGTKQVRRTIGNEVVDAAKKAGAPVGMVLKGGINLPDVDLKTLMQRSAGWDPETPDNRGLVYDAQRPVLLGDLLPVRQVSNDTLTYMEETTFTNNAAEATEGNTYGEAALALTRRSVPVEKVGVWLPITDEQLEDVVGIQGYLDNRLPFMVRQRIDYQLIQGSGVTPYLTGVLNKTSIQTVAKGGDVTPDAIYKAMTKVRVTGRATPGAVVMHPNDWQDIRLLRTADGIYIWGSPSDSGPERIWGQQVIQADQCTEGTAVVGDWAMYAELCYKRGIEVKVTDSHSTYFIEGKQAIRADVRCAVAWYRAEAFCTITGI
jgi:hypothetical protein